MSTSNGFRLPCRPKILPDEWVETYLVRLARANGIWYPWRSDIELLRRSSPATAKSGSDGVPNWGNITLPEGSIAKRGSAIRYCPACVEQSKYIRARWRLNKFDVCTVHNIRLKDDVVEHTLTQKSRRAGKHLLSEVTKGQLWAGAVCPMPIERRYIERTWSGFERSILERNLDQATSHLACAILMDGLLDTLADIDYKRTESKGATRRAQLAAKYEYLTTGSKEGISRFIHQITDPAHCRAARRYLHSVMYAEWRSPTCLSSMPIAQWCCRLQILVRAHQSQRKRGNASLVQVPLSPE